MSGKNNLEADDISGFSLVELIVVIAIIGIVMAIAIPNYSDWIRKNSIESQVRETYTLMQEARLSALQSKNRRVVVLDGKTLTLKNYSSSNESLFSGGTTVQTSSFQFDFAKLSGALYAGEHFVMNPQGIIEQTLNTVQIGNSNSGAAQNCIVVSKGRIQIGKVQSGACSF